jgi:quinoprotein glucose dehydrogenase
MTENQQNVYRFSGGKHLIIYLVILGFCGSACSDSNSNGAPEITYADAADFTADTSQVSVQLADGFELNLWAPGPLLSNAVSLSIDNNGVAYVSETSRRKSSKLDIREHRDWMTEDLGLQSLEDEKAFLLGKLATSQSNQNTWLEDFNQDSIHDWRDLEVQSEHIRRIWDSDGDGRADASNIFAQGFNTMLTGVAAGVLSYNGDVFFTVAPDVWRLKDLDGDGDADQRESISFGYGIHIAYSGHDMSGLTMGLDGRIYWAIGDHGVNVVDKNGKRWAFPNQGAVMRANPDGSEFEVFAHGLRNTQEFAFDAYGNLISVDNDGDHPGEHERFVHIIEGSDSGWRINWQYGKYHRPNESYKVWMDERLHVPHFSGQAAYLLPALALASDGPAGLAYNPGTALGQQWNDYFFASYFTGSSSSSKVQAFKLDPKGASFEVANEVDVAVGIVSTGVAFGPDGALYINDWLPSYDKKPWGRIWRLDYDDPVAQKQRKVTQQILQVGKSEKDRDELSDLMSNPDMRVRMAAQFELVNREENALLLNLAKSGENEFARLHAIWGLGQIARKDSNQAAVMVTFLQDANPNIRAQTAKVLGDARYQPAANLLVTGLEDTSPKVQFFAAEALGKLESSRAFQPLIDLLEQVGDSDPHMRHAITYALSKLNQEGSLAELAGHSSKDVRIGAVVALRHLKSAQIAVFLEDQDSLVVTEAARAIHDDFSIPTALPALARALNGSDIKDEAFIRRAINANLRLGDGGSARRLVEFASNVHAPEAMRADALWALGYWPQPPVLDRVDGRHRVLPERDPVDAQLALGTIIRPLLASKNEVILSAAITAIGRLNYVEEESTLFPLFNSPDQTLVVRQAALKAMATMKSSNVVEALNIALADQQQPLREEAQELIGSIELPEEVIVDILSNVFKHGSISERQKAIGSLAAKNGSEVEGLLGNLMDQLLEDKLPPSLVLDVLMAVEKSDFANLKTKKTEYEASKDEQDPLAVFRETLYGGNAENGRRIFYTNASAQCIRCHQLNGEGGEVGPALNQIASELSPEQLLTSLVAPSARIAPGYGTVILKLNNDQEVVGTLLEETEEFIVIKESDTTTRKILRNAIRELKNLPSGMFSMAQMLTKSEIRDLMALLSIME